MPLYLLEVGAQFYTIEEHIQGHWQKFNMNDGQVLDASTDVSKKAGALSHFVLQKTNGQSTILDMQGKMLRLLVIIYYGLNIYFHRNAINDFICK